MGFGMPLLDILSAPARIIHRALSGSGAPPPSGPPPAWAGIADPWGTMPQTPPPAQPGGTNLFHMLGKMANQVADINTAPERAAAQGGLFQGNGAMFPAYDHTREAHYADTNGPAPAQPPAMPAPQMRDPGPALQGLWSGGDGTGWNGRGWSDSTDGGRTFHTANAQAPGKVPGWQQQGGGSSIWKQG